MGVVTLFISLLLFFSVTSFAQDTIQCRLENKKVYHCNYTHHYTVDTPYPAFNCTLQGVNDYGTTGLDDVVYLTSYTPNVYINDGQSLIATTASKVNNFYFLPNLSSGLGMIIGIDIILLPGEASSNISVSCAPGSGGRSGF